MSAGSAPSAQPIELLRLRLRNESSAPETARQALQAPLQEQGISPRALYRLELVLEESLMNRLWHAFPEGGEHEIVLTLGLLPDVLVLRIEDDGIAFDPLQAPPPRPYTTLDEAQPGGLGLLLTRKAARHCHYERSGGRNRFTVHIDRV
jgi:serine/threonine-protein kinase RsbW